jgi:hypothetical protein
MMTGSTRDGSPDSHHLHATPASKAGIIGSRAIFVTTPMNEPVLGHRGDREADGERQKILRHQDERLDRAAVLAGARGHLVRIRQLGQRQAVVAAVVKHRRQRDRRERGAGDVEQAADRHDDHASVITCSTVTITMPPMSAHGSLLLATL